MSSTISKKSKIFVIILNYNGGKDLLKTIESVVDSSYKNLEIVLVDNNSFDNSLNLAKQWVKTHCSNANKFSQIHFIENKKNLGFGAGNNVGINFAFRNGADFVFLLNNDALVQKNTISSLISSIQDKKNIGLVSPIIYSDLDYKKVWFRGGKINWWKMRAEHFGNMSLREGVERRRGNLSKFFWKSGLVDNPIKIATSFPAVIPRNDIKKEIEYVTGCAMLISREVFEKVGLFDECFFLYYEDVDLSLRVKNAGFKNVVVTDSKVFHKEQSEDNQPQKIYWLVLSGILFFRKHAKGFWKVYLIIYLFLRKFKNFIDVKFRSNEVNLAVGRAYEDFEK